MPTNVVLFVSRNKDNKNITNFHERSTSFITHYNYDDEKLKSEFSKFVNEGVSGETSRMYYSVNERDTEKIYKDLLHFLIDEPAFDLCAMPSKLASIAAKNTNSKTKHWMFDFDINDIALANEFVEDIKTIDSGVEVSVHKTPNGYAIITDHGFDIRKLNKKWGNNVTLKRDDLLCVKWEKKE